MIAATPSGAAFDIVLLLHVAAVLVTLGAVTVSGVQAARLLALTARSGSAELPATLRTYYAPGINWMGRVSYLVPVLGFILLAMSRGAYGLHALWVQLGLGLWLLSALAAEGLLWPAERRLQLRIGPPSSEAAPGAVSPSGGAQPPAAETASQSRQTARTVCLFSAVIVVAYVVAVVLMVAKPA